MLWACDKKREGNGVQIGDLLPVFSLALKPLSKSNKNVEGKMDGKKFRTKIFELLRAGETNLEAAKSTFCPLQKSRFHCPQGPEKKLMTLETTSRRLFATTFFSMQTFLTAASVLGF